MPTETDTSKDVVNAISGLAKQVYEIRAELLKMNGTLTKIAERLPTNG